MSLYSVARGALFAMDAERAHELTLGLMRRAPGAFASLYGQQLPPDPVSLFGLSFANRIGLAAGLDKNADAVDALGSLGFGFIEIGTVTPRPQAGNARPRIFRLKRHGALINRLGFNNKGVNYAVRRLKARRYDGIIGVNIGKNADTPLASAADDYVTCLRRAYAQADYFTVNISSPNTRQLRELQHGDALRDLLAAVARARQEASDAHGVRRPILVKIAPDVAASDLASLVASVQAAGMDGMIATNTTISRPGLDGVTHADEAGGLSGRPLQPLAETVLRALRAEVGPDFPLIGVGGIDTGEAARARRHAGADLLQIYTGFIYRGPELIAEVGDAVLPADASIR